MGHCVSKHKEEPLANNIDSQPDTVNQLLEAEKKATEKINDARKRRVERMKLAKKETQPEIDKIRKEREGKFNEHEQKYLEAKKTAEAAILSKTEAELEAMQKKVAENKQKVVDRLLQLVSDIQPRVHHNYRKDKVLVSS